MLPFPPLIIGLPLIGFWLWMLIDLGKNDTITSDEKNRWFLVLFFLNVIGAFRYYLVEYRNRHL